jgi:hypothetical protein
MLLSSGDTYTSMHTKREIGKVLIVFLMLCAWMYVTALNYTMYMYVSTAYHLMPDPKQAGLDQFIWNMKIVCILGISGTMVFLVCLCWYVMKYYTDLE